MIGWNIRDLKADPNKDEPCHVMLPNKILKFFKNTKDPKRDSMFRSSHFYEMQTYLKKNRFVKRYSKLHTS